METVKTPRQALFTGLIALVLCAAAVYIGPNCDSVYRTCSESCKRLHLKCDVAVDPCKTACEALEQDTFVELTECVWNSPKCDDSLECWPYEDEAPWDTEP